MKEVISLTSGELVLVDREDYQWLSQYKWNNSPSGERPYASANVKDKSGKSRRCYMHRLIVEPKPGMYVDHINGNSLDNRRCNLRMCSPSQNVHNKKANKGCKYKGVRRSGSVYRMSISKNYPTEWQAANAYNELAVQLFGEFAYVNKEGEKND